MSKPHTAALPRATLTGEPVVRFLDAYESADEKAWLELWESWPQREVLAHPRYVRLFARPGDRVVCAAMRSANGGILHPFIVRVLADEPWAQEEPGCDLTSAYGYAGPFAWNVTASDADTFWMQMDAWARSTGVVTAFTRLGLFANDLLPFHGQVLDRGPNVVRDLRGSQDELWNDYGHNARKNVRRAQREGVQIEFDFTGARLDEFLAVYTATMDRREALKHYYFPKAFFESIVAGLPGQYVFAHAVCATQVVSSELILLSARHAYFFLGGTRAEAFDKRPNDLLKHESFRACRELGMSDMVLGGGYGPDEGLLRYKRKFAPHGDRPFRIGTRTYDPAGCARLVKKRHAWELLQGRGWPLPGDFFPPYRSGPISGRTP